ncbi:MAG: response regulator [Planctomycetes bacterium]|nr:response regulator [Planctomycetota bacterium]
MRENVEILVAEDDEGHFSLIRKNLVRAGIDNNIVRFADGQELLDSLILNNKDTTEKGYLLILDIRMPKVGGIEVLEKLRLNSRLRKIPVIVLTTTDDPKEVAICHTLGCSMYIVKPVEYDNYIDAIRKIGQFLSIIEIPQIDTEQ